MSNSDFHPGIKPPFMAGIDSYPGTWCESGVESWNDYLDVFHALAQKPIIIQEFGYSSPGEMMTPEEARSGAYPCEFKKWKFSWRGAYTPEIQADFIAEAYRIFAEKPFALGATYYCWRDHETCWQRGSPDCPAETGWGLIDRNKEPKPSFYQMKASLAAFCIALPQAF